MINSKLERSGSIYVSGGITLLIFVSLALLSSCKEDKETPTPSIVSFSPTSGSVGTTVNIIGTNFSLITADNQVKFNGTAATVTAATASSLTIAVPTGASTGKISVTVNEKTAISEVDFTVFNSPEITTFTPANGLPGTSVTITGKNFSATAADNIVKFNTLPATVTAATTTSLTATVPTGATTGKISITVHDLTTTSTDDFVVPPTITSFSPTSGIIGSTVTITGTGFSTTAPNNAVKFNNKTATITAATTTSLSTTVPAEATTGKISVTVTGQTATSTNDFIIVPTLTSFTPSVGAIGSTVIITGTGFSSTAANNVVKFNGTTASITTATITSLTVVVPVGATTGKLTVTVGTNTVTSLTDYEVVIEVIKAGGSNFDQGYSVAIDGSGNTFVSGRFLGAATFGNTTLTSAGSDDIFLVKYNSACEFIWAKQIGGSGADNSLSITVDAGGNIYTTGTFMGTVQFGSTSLSSNNGSGDIFLAKLNTSGDVVWAKQIGSAVSNVETGYSVKVDGSGNLYVTGSIFGTVTIGAINLTSAGASDVLVAKYNSTSGDVIWAKNFGGSDDEAGIAITGNTNGDVYVSGSFFGTAIFGSTNLISAGGLDAFVAKLNSSGDLVWVKQISGAMWENAFSLATDANGNCYVSGYFIDSSTFGAITLTSAGNEDIFLAKYSSSGEVLWAKSAGGNDYDESHSVAVDAAGNAYLTGYFARTATFGNNTLISSNNSRDIFVSKFNPSGELVWVKQAGATDNDEGLSVAVDASGTVYATGYFRETVIFGSTSLTSSGNDDIYLWKIRQ